MRRILAFILALLMISGALPALAEEAGPGLTLELFTGLPAGQYTALGNGLVLVTNYDENLYLIFDPYTGQTLPLHAEDADAEAWMPLLSAAWAVEGELVTPEELMDQYIQEGRPDILSFALPFLGLDIYRQGTHYARFRQGLVLDMHTGLLRPEMSAFPGSLNALTLFVGENYIKWDYGDPITLSLHAHDGSLLRSASVTPDDGPVFWRDAPDGFLFMMHSELIEKKACEISLVYVDGDLTVHPTVALGQWSNRALEPEQALLSASTGKMLLQTRGTILGTKTKVRDSETGRLTVHMEPYGPFLDGVIVVDMATGAVHPIAVEGDLLYLLGMSYDGSYALLLGGQGTLYRLDMDSLALTPVISAAELEALCGPGQGRSVWQWYGATLPWDGGDFIVLRNVIFRIIENP